MKETTYDTLYNGRLVLHQPKHGYRLSVDALLLTYFVTTGKPAVLCADLGTGCGVVGLGLLLSGHVKRVVGVEAQPRLAEIAVANGVLNGCESSFSLFQSDIRNSYRDLGKEKFDLVVFNPPFWPLGAGKPPHDEERHIASHSILGTLQDWTDTTARLLHQKRGHAFMVFPAKRLDDLVVALKMSKLSCTRLCCVHSIQRHPAELILVEAAAGKCGRIKIEPPIFLKNENGDDTDFAARLYSGAFSTVLMNLSDRRKASDSTVRE